MEAINRDAFPGFGPADWLAFARRTCREVGEGQVVFDYDPAIAAAAGLSYYAIGRRPSYPPAPLAL